MIRVAFARSADADVDRTSDYLVEQGGTELGLRFHRSMDETLRSLVMQPLLGVVVPLTIGQSIRRLRISGFPNYFVFYVAHPHGIEVVRVLHGARDLQGIFD